MPSVRAIAKRADVSITTVSRVLNNHPQISDEVRQRVLAATNAVGYVASVGRKSVSNLALLYTGDYWLGSPFDSAVMTGIQRAIADAEFELMILDARKARQPKETFTQMFLRKGIRGAIVRTSLPTRSVCEAIAEEGFPAVVVGDHFENPRVSYVYCDSKESSREAVEHLIGLGHRRIALSLNIIDDGDHADRYDGYAQALGDHGIRLDPKLVLRAPANREGGANLLRRLITMPDRPGAVFIADPLTVVGLVGEARKASVDIPRDLSIVGFDDSEIRYGLFPELTAVCQDAVDLGKEATASLLGLIEQAEGKKKPAPIRKALRCWLEIHGSSGPVAKASTDGKVRHRSRGSKSAE